MAANNRGLSQEDQAQYSVPEAIVVIWLKSSPKIPRRGRLIPHVGFEDEEEEEEAPAGADRADQPVVVGGGDEDLLERLA